ncbi:MAG: SH3 domain-containing protein [Thermoleophilia bacterium]
MGHLRSARAVTAVLVALGTLTLVACGDDSSSTPTTTTVIETATQLEALIVPPGPDDSASGGGSADGSTLCGPNESPNGLDHTVVDLPANDPDGGLVVHADAGASTPKTGLLTSGTPVITTNDPARCLVIADGGVWWEVSYGTNDQRGWVNSRYLTRTGAQETAARADMCGLYREVLSYRTGPGGFAPQALTADLKAALSGPPPGVSDALDRISSPADEADLALAYEDLTGYVGPICS